MLLAGKIMAAMAWIPSSHAVVTVGKHVHQITMAFTAHSIIGVIVSPVAASSARVMWSG